VLIEFLPQGVGGDLTQHVHTVYRDPTNEYGQALTVAPLTQALDRWPALMAKTL
jgi:hypothetical protein